MNNRPEQYYPTYTFKGEHRDVVLLEFEEAQKIANGQTKVYGQVTNILLAATTVLIPLFFNQDSDYKGTFSIIKEYAVFFTVILFLFGALILRYFVDLQKQITINARKVVTLRAMLGLDYGNVHLTLPNWRVEGATNPFAIKYFNGWHRFQTMPFWVLTIGVNSIWWVSTSERIAIEFQLLYYIGITIEWYWGNIIITLCYLYVFRHNLNDTHESSFLNLGRFISSFLNRIKVSSFKLVPNFEYIIYRAKLDVVEMQRLNVDYSKMKKILVEIEDKDFYSNKKGVSFKAILRGTASQIKPLRKMFNLIKSGGSTISMQLARTLFISTHQYIIRRKLAEIWIAFWMNKKFSKNEIIDLYIVSVRYDKGIFGLSKAIKHFFGYLPNRNLTYEECFVLVERLSNETATLNYSRIDFLHNKVRNQVDKMAVMRIYERLKVQGKIR